MVYLLVKDIKREQEIIFLVFYINIGPGYYNQSLKDYKVDFKMKTSKRKGL